MSRSTYAALFNEIGTTYGAGNGTTTFNLPDGRGRALIGAGTGTGLTARALGENGGAETHQLATGEMPSHRHRLLGNGSLAQTAVGLGDGSSRAVAGNSNTTNISYIDTNNGQILVEGTGGGGAHNNMQPWLAENMFIYVGL